MALKKRERNLAIATAVLMVLFLGRLLWSTWGGPANPRLAQREQLTRDVARMKRQIESGHKAEQRLAQWRTRSLPSDEKAARSVYQNWLLGSAESAGFTGTKVEARAGRPHGDVYRALSFGLQAETTLENLTRFLHAFYASGYLHQIQGLNLVPRDNGAKLEVRVTVEALILANVDRTNELPEKPAKPVLATEPSQYAQTIAGRNVFAPSRPPAPPAPPEPEKPPVFDASKHVYLTAIVAVGDEPQAWIVNRTSGECLKLRQGDQFDVGEHHGKIQRIGQREAEIELDGHSCVLSLGEHLPKPGN
jgi:hypothetical protein